MNRDYFWLSDEQFARLQPYLPTGTRGKPRVDDRRVISGIIHVIKAAGAGWTRLPSTARAKPSTTAYHMAAAASCPAWKTSHY
ncbi:transposase [Mesorhizobium sp.]|uniref:transposase n=1 Tax=Mesorhizobium sp. TaxID=1871066 RepID=UPI001225B1E0|nr:MAG: transposase [Mesorhizobium sp.]